jgi:hypothetical protein
MSLETRSNSALFKRAEQLKRWEDSDTNREPVYPKQTTRRIKFSSGCVFLAACAAGDKEEVLRLLENGADINTANVDGLTALHQVICTVVERIPPVAGYPGFSDVKVVSTWLLQLSHKNLNINVFLSRVIAAHGPCNTLHLIIFEAPSMAANCPGHYGFSTTFCVSVTLVGV